MSTIKWVVAGKGIPSSGIHCELSPRRRMSGGFSTMVKEYVPMNIIIVILINYSEWCYQDG